MTAVGSMRLEVSGGGDVDLEELQELTLQLRRRLLELDVNDIRVERSAGAVPKGAKPGEVMAAGVLAVTLAPALVRPVLRLVETWMRSRPVRTVKVDLDGCTLELHHASAEQQQHLVNAFLAEVRRTSSADESPAAPGEAVAITGDSGEPPAARE